METNKDRFLTIDDFRKKYLDNFKVLRDGLTENLITPHPIVADEPLTGGAIADFVPEFADAINAQEPLNVPSLFESSRNDAINKAITKFRRDLDKNMDDAAKEAARPTRALERVCDTDIILVLS